MNILVNDKATSFGQTDLPILISGIDKAGASLFTVVTAINLFRNGHKILFLSAYPMAIEKFMELLTDQEKTNVKIVENGVSISDKKVIIIKPGDEDLFIAVYNSLPDINDRVIILKNFEQYTKALQCAIHSTKIILSGDVDKTPYLEKIKEKDFITKIFFSKPKLYPVNQFITLEKYTGTIIGPKFEGKIKIQTD